MFAGDRSFLFLVLGFALTGCNGLLGTQQQLNMPYLVQSFGPTQGYSSTAQVLRITGTNLQATDTVMVGSNRCTVNSSLTTATVYTCNLPRLCATSMTCTYPAGQTLAVSYTQNGQTTYLPQNYRVAGYRAPAAGSQSVSLVQVYSNNYPGTSITERILGQDGGQTIYFTFTQTLTDALLSVTLGSADQVPCNAIQADSRGALTYQCTTGAYDPALGSPISLTLQPISFHFAHSGILTVPSAFYFTAAGSTCTDISTTGTSAAVAEDCATQSTVGSAYYTNSTTYPLTYDLTSTPYWR